MQNIHYSLLNTHYSILITLLEHFIIDRIKAELPFEPNKEKEELFLSLGRFLVSRTPRKAFILRGYAGTGKTSVMSALVNAMKGLKQACVLLAPTGRAAKVLSKYSRMPAYTIHKYIYRQNQLGQEAFSLAHNKHINTLFIVDEASMLSGARDNTTFGTGCLLDDLISFVYSGQGCSLLLVGDNAQLPPVGNNDSPALEDDFMAGYGLDISSFSLKEVARQALNSGILANATRLREILSNDDMEGSLTLDTYPDVIRLKGEEVVDTLEQSWREVGAEETLVITRSNKMTNLYNQGIRARILWKEELISSGDRVMITKNNYFWAKEYQDLDFIANGDILEITRLYGQHEMYGFHFAKALLRSVDYDWEIDVVLWLETIHSDNPDTIQKMHKDLFYKIAEDYPELQHRRKELTETIYKSPYYNALQIRMAYAITGHKSQGGQWARVFIDPYKGGEEKTSKENIIAYYRWLYTTITRATEKVYFIKNT